MLVFRSRCVDLVNLMGHIQSKLKTVHGQITLGEYLNIWAAAENDILFPVVL